ncbi:DUF1127 domain-containing protein [Bradyrhizobium sp. AZCC 1577]|uniref:DUF1127 domain-containing protein n=1 Tax=unclassified Bradyrhizobium TaxID=2631580 RepID=UPI002FEF030D
MSTIRGTTELGPVTARRQVYSPLETYWNAFQEWRKRRRLLAHLCDLSDRELKDIGITRGEIDYLASHRGLRSARYQERDDPLIQRRPSGGNW